MHIIFPNNTNNKVYPYLLNITLINYYFRLKVGVLFYNFLCLKLFVIFTISIQYLLFFFTNILLLCFFFEQTKMIYYKQQ